MTASEDDPSIADDEVLLRRITPSWVEYNAANPLQSRITSQAFQNYRDTDTMSIHILSVLHANGQDVASILAGHEGYGVAAITAGHFRSCGQGVVRAPTAAEPAHGHVVGPKKQSGVRRKIGEGAALLVAPTSQG